MVIPFMTSPLTGWRLFVAAVAAFMIIVPISMGFAWLFLQLLIWLIADTSNLRMMLFTWLLGCLTGFIIAINRKKRRKTRKKSHRNPITFIAENTGTTIVEWKP